MIKDFVIFYNSVVNFSKVQWQLFHFASILLFDQRHWSSVSLCYQVNCHTFSSQSPCSSNPVNILLQRVWHVVVNHQIHLLDINSSTNQVSRYQNSRLSLTELFHHSSPLLIWHVTCQHSDWKLQLLKLSRKLNCPVFCVHEQNALTDFQVFVKLNQCTKFLTLVSQSNEKLFDSFHRHLLLLQ